MTRYRLDASALASVVLRVLCVVSMLVSLIPGLFYSDTFTYERTDFEVDQGFLEFLEATLQPLYVLQGLISVAVFVIGYWFMIETGRGINGEWEKRLHCFRACGRYLLRVKIPSVASSSINLL